LFDLCHPADRNALTRLMTDVINMIRAQIDPHWQASRPEMMYQMIGRATTVELMSSISAGSEHSETLHLARKDNGAYLRCKVRVMLGFHMCLMVFLQPAQTSPATNFSPQSFAIPAQPAHYNNATTNASNNSNNPAFAHPMGPALPPTPRLSVSSMGSTTSGEVDPLYKGADAAAQQQQQQQRKGSQSVAPKWNEGFQGMQLKLPPIKGLTMDERRERELSPGSIYAAQQRRESVGIKDILG